MKLAEVLEENISCGIAEHDELPLTIRENRMIWLCVSTGLLILGSLLYFFSTFPG